MFKSFFLKKFAYFVLVVVLILPCEHSYKHYYILISFFLRDYFLLVKKFLYFFYLLKKFYIFFTELSITQSEFVENRKYSNKVDLWSIGVILYELKTCK